MTRMDIELACFRGLNEKGHHIWCFRPERSDYYFKGHFPGRPIVPGVLLLEVSLRILASERGLPRHQLTVKQINKLTYLRPVLPDETVEIITFRQGERIKIEGGVKNRPVFRFDIVF